MDLQGPGRLGMGQGAGGSVGIDAGDDVQFSPLLADQRDLGGPGKVRHENPRPVTQAARGIGDGGAMVATRGRHHAGLGNRLRQKGVEGATGLEAAGMLHLLQLQHHAAPIWQVKVNHGGAADMAADAIRRCVDFCLPIHALSLPAPRSG